MCFFTKSSEKFLEMHNDICIVNFNFTQSYNSIKVVCVDIMRITWPVKDLKGSAVNHTFQLVNGIEDIITEKKKIKFYYFIMVYFLMQKTYITTQRNAILQQVSFYTAKLLKFQNMITTFRLIVWYKLSKKKAIQQFYNIQCVQFTKSFSSLFSCLTFVPCFKTTSNAHKITKTHSFVRFSSKK